MKIFFWKMHGNNSHALSLSNAYSKVEYKEHLWSGSDIRQCVLLRVDSESDKIFVNSSAYYSKSKKMLVFCVTRYRAIYFIENWKS